MLITLYKIGELHFRLLGTNGFHVKAKSERFTASSSRRHQNLKYENFMSLFCRLRQTLHQKACRMCSTIIFLHSTNQIFDLWCCRSRCHRQILNSLMTWCFHHGLCQHCLGRPHWFKFRNVPLQALQNHFTTKVNGS